LASFGFMAAAPEFLHEFASAQSEERLWPKEGPGHRSSSAGGRRLEHDRPARRPEYYNIRRTIAVPKPNQTNGAIDLDGYFGFNPAMKPLEALWNRNSLR
jgi:hypothetical protein